MFTDLVGSTALKDQLGTEGYLPLLRRHDELLRKAVEAVGGWVQQDLGDGCFAVFATSSEAVRAALQFQWGMRDRTGQSGGTAEYPLSRVGIHLGEVAETEVRQAGGQKLVGVAVDLAARVMSLAAGGQILLTKAAFNDARQFIRAHPWDDSLPLRWMAHGPYVLKGSDDPVDVFEVGVDEVSPLIPPSDSEKARRWLRAGDEATLGWRPALGSSLPGSPMWVIEKKLGEGGFGEVWRARHSKSNAVRVFKFCFNSERLAALKREVTLFRLLKQALGERRDIARVIDWRLDAPPYFIEMENAPEGNLAEWAQRQGGIGQIPLAQRLGIVADIARALSAAHSVGILHKDIKPSNVLMVDSHAGGTYPRLSDFGIGMLADRRRFEQFNITSAGFTASDLSMNDSSRTGTRMYAPPESLSDRPHSVQGDLYALGVMLYQLVVGDLCKPLGVGWERDVADDLLREDIAACVDVEPVRRLTSASELAERVEGLERRRAERSAQARQKSALLTARRRRTQLRAMTVALVLLTAVSATITLLWREASFQRGAARTEAAETAREARRVEARENQIRVTLARALVEDGWKDFDNGDVSFAILRFAEAVRLDPTAAHRLRVACALDSAPHQCEPPSGPHDWSDVARLTSGTHRLEVRGREATVVDVQSGNAVFPVVRGDTRVSYATFDPDGRRVRIAFEGGRVLTLDASTGAQAVPPMLHGGWTVRCMAFSRDGTRLVTASDDNTAKVWDAMTGRELTGQIPHRGHIDLLAFCPDGDKIIVAGARVARVWDLKTMRPVTPPLEHGAAIKHVGFTSEGSVALTMDESDTVHAWDATPVKARMPLFGSGTRFNVEDAVFSPDGRMIATAGMDQCARLWDARTGQEVTPPLKPGGAVWRVAFSPDGSRVVTASDDGTAWVWDARTGAAILGPLRHDAGVRCAVFSPDGKRILTGCDDGAARIWDAATGKLLVPPVWHEERVTQASFSPDGRMVLTASWDATARLWDAATGAPLGSPMRHGQTVRCATFSPDGSLIATASDDNTARVWDTRTTAPVTPSLTHNRRVQRVVFSPDGRRVVTASEDSTARVWDARTGLPLTAPMEHGYSVGDAAISPDGQTIVTAGWKGRPGGFGGETRMWDAATGLPITPLYPDTDLVERCSFKPDGSQWVTAAWDGAAHVWAAEWTSMSDADLISFAQVCAGHVIENSATLVPMEPSKWRHQFKDLRLRFPERFLDPPTEQSVRRELVRTPVDRAGLRRWAAWCEKRGEFGWAADLLRKAREAGDVVNASDLARLEWRAARREAAAIDFEGAIASNSSPQRDAWLKQCLAAVKRREPPETQVAATSFWWDYPFPPAGPRIWQKLNSDTWQETQPDGSTKRFRTHARSDPVLGDGWIAECITEPGLEVWIPTLHDGNQTFFRKGGADGKWGFLGAIHVGMPTDSSSHSK